MTDISLLPRFTVEEFQADFDALFERVEKNRETLVIVDDNEKEFLITPCEPELEAIIHSDKNTDHG
jgi:PHD/YefM family antitoxin component YafN of YafNO toxin-antitoxin module